MIIHKIPKDFRPIPIASNRFLVKYSIYAEISNGNAHIGDIVFHKTMGPGVYIGIIYDECPVVDFFIWDGGVDGYTFAKNYKSFKPKSCFGVYAHSLKMISEKDLFIMLICRNRKNTKEQWRHIK